MSLFNNKQFFVGGAVVLVGGWYVAKKAKEASKSVGDYLLNDAVNVTSENNIANTAVRAVVGKENLQSGFDKFFALSTLVNPFTSDSRRKFAKSVLGAN